MVISVRLFRFVRLAFQVEGRAAGQGDYIKSYSTIDDEKRLINGNTILANCVVRCRARSVTVELMVLGGKVWKVRKCRR